MHNVAAAVSHTDQAHPHIQHVLFKLPLHCAACASPRVIDCTAAFRLFALQHLSSLQDPAKVIWSKLQPFRSRMNRGDSIND